jgi:hypothetical protein
MKWLFIFTLVLNIIFWAYNSFYVVIPNSIITHSSGSGATDNKQLLLLSELDDEQLNTLQGTVLKKPALNILKTIENDVVQADANQESQSKEQQNSVIQNQDTEKQNLCYIVGPLNKKDMDTIRLTLEAQYNKELSFGIETTSKITYYRIYIPPLVSKTKIKETIALLDKNNLKDHYVMSIDGRKNAIALGVFKHKNAAEKIARIAKKINLHTTIEAISDDKNSLYKLQISFQKSHNQAFYQSLIGKKQIKSIECLNKG